MGLLTLLLLQLLLVGRGALAAQPPGAFLTRTLTTADGLGGTDVRALELGAPGELLVGTEAGARRFDGGRFEALSPPPGLDAPGVKAILPLEDGALIASEGGLWRWGPEGAQMIAARVMPGLHVALERLPDGRILMADGEGIFEVHLSPPRLEPLLAGELPDGLGPRALLADEGGVWVGGVGGLYRLEDGRLSWRTDGAVRALLADDEGPLVGREDGLYRSDGSEVLLHPRCFVTSLARMKDGRVVAGCGDGARLGRPGGAWEQLDEARGLPGPVVMSAAADPEGNLWLGSFGQGLVRVSNLDVRIWGRESGLPSNRALMLPLQEGGLLLASLGGAVALSPDLTPTPVPMAEDDGLFDVTQDADGRVYGITYGHVWRLLPGPAELIGEAPYGAAILVTLPSGVFVADTSSSMLRPVGSEAEPFPVPEDLLDARLVSLGPGELVGAGVDGIWQLVGDLWTRRFDGPGRCQRGEAAMEGEALWVGCSRGVFRREGDGWVAALESETGEVRDLLALDGEIWASLSDRLVRVWPSELVIDRQRGLPAVGLTPSGGRGLEGLAGWLLASSERGVIWLRPESFEEAPAPPVARIAGVNVGGISVAPDAIPHDAALIRVALSEDSLSDPGQIDYRFRLDDTAWSEATGEDSLQLAGLGPGRHRLEVVARRDGGAWSEEMAALDFHIRPAWWQRRGVQAGLGLALLGGLGVVVLERTRRFRAELRLLRERKDMLQTFGRFLTTEVAEDVMSGRLRAEGENRDVTVIFADIRGFTPMSARMQPRDVVALLNAWFSAMVAEIEAEGGTVNKFMGDAVIAVFGAPRHMPDHADRALRAATAMARAAERLETPLRARFGETVRAGIGVNSGMVVAGPVGSPNRMEYTVYGDTVNIAARVEALTRTLEADVLVADDTVQRLTRPFELVHLGAHELRGVPQPVTIWRLTIPRLGDAELQEQLRRARERRKKG